LTAPGGAGNRQTAAEKRRSSGSRRRDGGGRARFVFEGDSRFLYVSVLELMDPSACGWLWCQRRQAVKPPSRCLGRGTSRRRNDEKGEGGGGDGGRSFSPACVVMCHKSGVTASRTAGKGTVRAYLGGCIRVVVGCYHLIPYRVGCSSGRAHCPVHYDCDPCRFCVDCMSNCRCDHPSPPSPHNPSPVRTRFGTWLHWKVRIFVLYCVGPVFHGGMVV
jgi:hypothetical protein